MKIKKTHLLALVALGATCPHCQEEIDLGSINAWDFKAKHYLGRQKCDSCGKAFLLKEFSEEKS